MRDENSSTAAAVPFDPSVLLALAERCEREEPSAALDFAIWEAVNARSAPVGTFEEWVALPYTTSLDTAVTLVLDECGLDTSRYWLAEGERHGCLISWGIAGEHAEVLDAKSGPLAICAAALKARAAIAGNVQALDTRSEGNPT